MKIQTARSSFYKVYFKSGGFEYFCAVNLSALQKLLNATYPHSRLINIEVINDQVVTRKGE